MRTQFETGQQPAFSNPSHSCHGPLNPGHACDFFLGGDPEPLLLPAGTRSTPRQKEACDAHIEGRPITSRTSLSWCVGDPTSLAPRRDVSGVEPLRHRGSGAWKGILVSG